MDPALAVRRICLAVDVEHYSRRGDAAQDRVQRTLAELMRRAHAAAAPAAALARQPSGDGEVALLDSPADEVRFLSDFVHSLWTDLAEDAPPGPGGEAPLRLRMAVHCGIAWLGDNGFVGRAVVKTCRMLDSPALRAALRDEPGSRLALMVSDSFFDDVVRRDPPGLSPARFAPARAGEPGDDFDGAAWIWTGAAPKAIVRAVPRPPGRERAPAPPVPAAGPVVAPLAAMSVTVHPDASVGTLIQATEIIGGIHLAPGAP